MTGKKTRLSTDEKIRIILQTFNPRTGMAGLCRRHNLPPRTVCVWKERFPAGGRSPLGGSDAAGQARLHKKEIGSPRRMVGEYAMANAALKNTGGVGAE